MPDLCEELFAWEADHHSAVGFWNLPDLCQEHFAWEADHHSTVALWNLPDLCQEHFAWEAHHRSAVALGYLMKLVATLHAGAGRTVHRATAIPRHVAQYRSNVA